MSARIVTLLFCLIACACQGQQITELTWADQSLGQCVLKQAANNDWQTVEQVTALKCHKAGVEIVQDLSKFTQLQRLSLYNNKIENADLTELTQLKTLNLASNKLRTLNITGLGKLETLFLFKNKLTRLDLSGLSSVKKLRLMQNNLVELDITPLQSLETGYFFDNQLEDLQITGLDKLTFLDVKQNPMPDELYDFYDKQQGIVISHDGNADDWQ